MFCSLAKNVVGQSQWESVSHFIPETWVTSIHLWYLVHLRFQQQHRSAFLSYWTWLFCSTSVPIWDAGVKPSVRASRNDDSVSGSSCFMIYFAWQITTIKFHHLSLLQGGGFRYFCFHPYLGKWSNLTSIFQMGWNHQLDYIWAVDNEELQGSFNGDNFINLAHSTWHVDFLDFQVQVSRNVWKFGCPNIHQTFQVPNHTRNPKYCALGDLTGVFGWLGDFVGKPYYSICTVNWALLLKLFIYNIGVSCQVNPVGFCHFSQKTTSGTDWDANQSHNVRLGRWDSSGSREVTLMCDLIPPLGSMVPIEEMNKWTFDDSCTHVI